MAHTPNATPAEAEREQVSTSTTWLRLNTQSMRWLGKIGGALGDQAVFSGSNTIINIVLARHLTADEYGAFVVVYVWFTLSQNMYDAFLIEPMAIFGSGKYANVFRQYLGNIYIGHIAFSLLLLVVMAIATFITSLVDSQLVTYALLGVTLSAPLLLTRWLTRQPFYILAKPQWSAVGGLIYFVIGLVGIFGLDQVGQLTPVSALLAMGIASLVSSTILTQFLIKPEFRGATSLSRKTLLREHWNYGKWSSASKMMNWIPINLYYVLLPMLAGLSATGALRAINILQMPLNMGITATLGLLLPMFANMYVHSGKAGLERRVKVVLAAFLLITAGFNLLFILLGIPLMNLLFDGQYNEYATLPILITSAATNFNVCINVVLDAALRVTGAVKQSFLSTVLPGVLTLTLGVALLATNGILGANIASIIIGIITSLTLVYFYRRMKDEPAAVQQPQPTEASPNAT